MKTFRMVTAFAVLALLVALVPATFAQDFGLSAEDSAALSAANAATAAATSGDFTFELGLTGSAEGEAFGFSATGTGSFGQDASGEPAFQVTLNGQADMGEQGQMPIQVDLLWLENTAYITAPALFGGPQAMMISPEAMGQMSAGLPFDPAALASGDLSGLEGMEGMEGLGEAMAALSALQPELYINMTRNGDQFTTTVDVTGLVGSEGFQELVRTSIEANADEVASSGMSEAEINQIMASLSTALEGTSLTLDQYVTGGVISRTVFALALNVDPSAIGQEGEAVNLALTFDIGLTGLNEPNTFAAPENAVDLMESMGASS